MTSATPSADTVQRVFDRLGPPGTPFTTPEIAAEFDCSDRTIYNRLDALVEAGDIETKKVGAKGRVWWKPVESEQAGGVGSNREVERLRSLSVFDSDLIGVVVWGEDVTITDANDAFLEMAGLDYREAIDTSWRDLTPEAFYSASDRHIQEVEETGSGVPYEKQYYHADGSRWWGLFESRRLNDSEKVEFVVDITERKETEQELRESEAALERLNATTQELIDAESEMIADPVAPLAREVLDVEYAALWQYDDRHGDLDEYAVDVSPDVDGDAVEFPTEIADRVWETFVGTDVVVANDLDVPTDATSPLRSCAFIPLGRHGVVCLGSTGADTFDERTVDLVETVASTIETAWDRAESEAELERQNEELTRLDRLNALIREIDQALVAVDTREELDASVCENLADSAFFEFAWYGEHDADAGDVVPRAWAGVDSTTVEDLTVAPDGSRAREGPFAAAIRTGERQVIADIATDARAAPWREAALAHGGRSCLCIPLVYEESIFGVLVVYGGTPQPDERDVDVLSELGENIAHAIHTVEARVMKGADSVVELTLQTTTADTPLVRLARELNCVIEFEGLVSGADGETTVFFTARDVAPDEVAAAAEQSLAFEELIQLAERDDGHRFKTQVIDEPLAAGFLEGGGTIRSLTIDVERVTAVVALAETADIRGFIEGVKRDVPDLDLLARRSRRRLLDTTQHLQTAFEERLTPRQREILQLAYRSGYFESPRVQTGQELSEALDLSQSTFNHHLRGAERRIFEVVFGNA
ncbi:bacterio-opsin activator domain-containing protein [Natrialbaceae archaeon A-gly3]